MLFSFLEREIHPDGLPPSYTLILLFRLLPDTPKDAFDLWQISDSSNNPEVGLTLSRKCHFLHSLHCMFVDGWQRLHTQEFYFCSIKLTAWAFIEELQLYSL